MNRHRLLPLTLAVSLSYSASLLSALDPGTLAGNWTNIDKGTSSTIRMEIINQGGAFFLKTWGAGTRKGVRTEIPHQVRKLAMTTDAASRASMTATWDTGFSIVENTITMEDGKIVMKKSTTFTDDSGRKPYYVKEYFVPSGQRR